MILLCDNSGGFWDSLTLDPKISIPETLQVIATVWIAIILQRIATRTAQKGAETHEAVRLYREIISRCDEIQMLLIGFPLSVQVRQVIARKIESISQDIDILRSSKELFSHPDYEWLANSAAESLLEFESLTNDLAAQAVANAEAHQNQKDASATLIQVCNNAVLTLSLTT